MGVVAALAMVLGALVLSYGFVLVPVSVLGGLHIGAIGLSMLLAGLFATEWAGARWGLSTATRTRLSVGFAVLAVLLLVAFAVINGMTFESSESGGRTSS